MTSLRVDGTRSRLCPSLPLSLSLRERGEGRGEGPFLSAEGPSPGASRHPLPASQGEGLVRGESDAPLAHFVLVCPR